MPADRAEPTALAEAVHLAGALAACSRDEAARKRYVAFVFGRLAAPPADLPPEKIEA